MSGPLRFALVVAPLASLWLVPTADAALRAKTSLVTQADATRIVVKLRSTTRLPARSRPRQVSVRTGARTYKLRRQRGRAAAAVSLGTWRSRGYRGTAAAKLLRQAGRRVTLKLRSRAGTKSLRPRLAAPRGTGPPSGPVPPALRPAAS